MMRRRLHVARTMTLLLVAILTGAFVFYAVFDAASRESSSDDRASIRTELDQTRTELDETRNGLDGQRSASEALAQQVEDLGEEPVIEPRDAEGGTTIPRTPSAASPAGVLTAVRALIGGALQDACDGDCAGEDGEPLPPVPPADPLPPIQPAEPVPGKNGTDGKDGTNGANGTNGRDAPRITGITCSGGAGQSFTFTLDDGTTYDVVCQGPVEPDPDPADVGGGLLDPL